MLPLCYLAQTRITHEQAKTPPTQYPWHTQQPATSSPVTRKTLPPSESLALLEQQHNKEPKNLCDTPPQFQRLLSSLPRTIGTETEATKLKELVTETGHCCHVEGSQLRRRTTPKVLASKRRLWLRFRASLVQWRGWRRGWCGGVIRFQWVGY